jgi:hypothetical protein
MVGVLAESPLSSNSALRPLTLSFLPRVGIKISENLSRAIDDLEVQLNTSKE